MTNDQQPLSLFQDDDDTSQPATTATVDPMMSEATRGQLREAFANLGIVTAREQFTVVAELTGQRITSVGELTQRHAQTLLLRLSRRVDASGARVTGNAWADRTEETWIDKM
ncbi:hypothetical protein [Microbacterium sp. BDGP8]|uniref:hypothetical protein n=1 Tax=Microbacterium sp. BDGP8 TaxID=3035531 RepID=UPI00249EA699|nr:hypothetical protein [Microbacterium sp. BDGP8]WHE37814.1 hypothetical protein P6897_15915 [Microbacterium sp. BDGP8]